MARAAEPGAAADELARRILASAKYRHLDEGLVRRVAAQAADRCADDGQAVKYAKRKLHQAVGAFTAGSPAAAVTGAVAAVRSGAADLRAASLAAMRAHASAAERARWLEPLYQQVADWCGTPASVADLACGLNPLAIPWMTLAPGASYWACEVDATLVTALAGLAEVMPVSLTVTGRDLVAAPPPLRADVALLLKTVTTLEQQAPGAAGRVLAALRCAHVVLSLPRRSLSGRRGYADDADAIAAAAVADSSYEIIARAQFGSEVLYHLAQAGQSPR